MNFIRRPTLRVLLSLALAVASASASPLRAAEPGGGPTRPNLTPDGTPTIVKTASGTTEVGTLSAVPYRIDIPANWNHGLVVFFHRLHGRPLHLPCRRRAQRADPAALRPRLRRHPVRLLHLRLGARRSLPRDRAAASLLPQKIRPGDPAHAAAHPSRSQTVAPQAQAERSRDRDTSSPARPMGGALVTAELELNPKPFAGGLDICGSVGPTDLAFQRRFAWRAAFDFYFPGLMPPLVPTPQDFQESSTLRTRIIEAMRANPIAATAHAQPHGAAQRPRGRRQHELLHLRHHGHAAPRRRQSLRQPELSLFTAPAC